MGRKRIQAEPLTNAEKQRRHREKQKARIAALETAADGAASEAPAEVPDTASIREQLKAELKTSWEAELQAERAAAERKEGRRLARQKDKNREHGRIEGICRAAGFFVGKDRADIARELLSHFCIDREKAAAVLEADRRTKSLTLASLDGAGAWGKPRQNIK